MTYTADVSMFPYFKTKINADILQEQLKLKDFEIQEQSDYIDTLIERQKELKERVIEVNRQKEKLHMENVSLKEFKEKAEDSCEGFAITETFMDKIEELTRIKNDYKEMVEERQNTVEYLLNKVEHLEKLVVNVMTKGEDTFDKACENIEKFIQESDIPQQQKWAMVEMLPYDVIDEDEYPYVVCQMDDPNVQERFVNDYNQDMEDMGYGEDTIDTYDDVEVEKFVEWYNDLEGIDTYETVSGHVIYKY